MEPKILLFDIENAPNVTWAWGIHDDPSHSMKFVKQEWYVMCWAAKWLGKKKILSSSCIDFNYNKNKPNDKKLLKKLRDLLDEADIVIAHNGRKFDCRKANARFIKHNITPPSPYRVIDTLTEARRYFMFTSNRLGDLGKYLGAGDKIDTGGFELWIDCMAGKRSAWNKMVKYCKGDVELLERVYLKLRPYMQTHPNLSVIRNDIVCPRCESKNLISNGYKYNQAGKIRRFQCKDCGGYGSYQMKKDTVKGVRS